MFPVISLTWFFLFKYLNQGGQDSNDFFFQIADGLSTIQGSIWLAGFFLLCSKVFTKSVDGFATTFVIILVFTINNSPNDFVVKTYDFNAQLQTILNLIHPPLVHCSLYLTLVFLFKPKIIVSFYAWLLAGVALLIGSTWAFTELGWGSFWFYDPIETYSFLYWILLACLLPLHIKNYAPLPTLSVTLMFFLIYPKFFLNNSLHNFSDTFFLDNNELTLAAFQTQTVLISIALLTLASSRASIKRHATEKTRIVKIALTLIFTILVFSVACLLMLALEEAKVSRAMLISTVFYLFLKNNKNHNEIAYVMLNIFILQTWNTDEIINEPEPIFFKIEEMFSKNHSSLSNSMSFKQTLIDSNKTSNLLKTKEIYCYKIVDYSEDSSTGVNLIAGSYSLGITYAASKAIKGL